MAITQTAVSYYGLNYVEHAERDFIEMKEHGCTTVILAITEFDMDFWFPNINNIVKKRTSWASGSWPTHGASVNISAGSR
jgi:hypothetical protein